MSIQIFSPLTVNKNSSKVITAVEESSSPPTGKQEEERKRGVRDEAGGGRENLEAPDFSFLDLCECGGFRVKVSKLQYTNPPEGRGLFQEVEIMHTISKKKDTGGKVRNSKVAKKKSEKKERVWGKEHKRVTKVTNEWGWLKVEERQESTEGKQKRGSLRTAKGVQTVKAHTEKKKERRIR